jgi:hypothetical protein
MSIYSNNSIISNNLMKILYSEDSKENIQTKIETYLINHQNKLLLTDIGNEKLNFTKLNPKILDVLMESKLMIQKLYLNTLLHLKHLNKNDDQYFSLNILSKVKLDDIMNIIFGRVFLIISHNTFCNKFTQFTDVSYDLGRELISKYNYQLYLLHNDNKITFSQFILNNATIIINCDDPTKIVGLGSILIG